MKKLFVLFALVIGMFALTSCSLLNQNKYEEEAGVYNCYYISGDLSLSMYDYYRITLNADGTCLVESKAKGSSQTYSAEATFSIENNKIKIVTRSGAASVTEEYDYIDGEIQMLNQSIQGISFTAKFRRDQ